MGDYTDNGYFYKPALGASGSSEKSTFDTALDGADTQIESNKDKLANGEMPALTTAEITAITGLTSKILQVYNTDTGQVELWVYGSRKPNR